MLRGLSWVGARAQWFLALGVIAALIVPGPGAVLDGTVVIWVAVLFGLAMARIDLGAVARRAVDPRRLVRNLGLLVLLMGVTPALFWGLGTLAGLDPVHIEALVYTSAAPPLGSATAFCLMLGLDAAFALELTVLGSFLAPVSLPVVARALLGEAIALDVIDMMGRLALVIGSATIGAVILRRVLTAAWIDAQARAFDGMASIILVLFLFPLFHGMPGLIASIPLFALVTFVLAVLANLGVQIASFPATRAVAGREAGGAVSLIWGNRNAALTLSFLPEAPLIVLYIALYQFPMYFTPLVMRRVIVPR